MLWSTSCTACRSSRYDRLGPLREEGRTLLLLPWPGRRPPRAATAPNFHADALAYASRHERGAAIVDDGVGISVGFLRQQANDVDLTGAGSNIYAGASSPGMADMSEIWKWGLDNQQACLVSAPCSK